MENGKDKDKSVWVLSHYIEGERFSVKS